MPYASDKQRRWAHTASARKAGFPTAKWDREEGMRGAIARKLAKRKKK